MRTRQPLTRGQQRPRKPQSPRRQIDTRGPALAMIGSVIVGLFASRVVEGGGLMLKLTILVLAAIILWQNHGLLLAWARALVGLVKR